MNDILNKIVNNNVLFIGIIIVLSIVLMALIVLIIKSVRENKKINIYEEELEDEDIKKVKNVKKEDIIESPKKKKKKKEKPQKEEVETEEDISEEEISEEEEKLEEEITEEEIEERYETEKVEEIEEVKEETTSKEIEELLDKMEKESKMKPEDVVANFEKEQEAQSIISYKELVDAVKNRNEEEYEDELESQPLTTVKDFIKEEEEEVSTDTEEILKNITKDVEMSIDDSDIEELVPSDDEIAYAENKFKKTDVISPVYGVVEEETKEYSNIPKMDETIDISNLELSDVDFISDNETALSALDDIYKHMAEDLMEKEDIEDSSALEELTKNEEFLQSLKDFRNKL